MGGPKIFFFQSCFFTLSDMFMTRINHKIDKNHPNNIFFSFFTQFIPNFEQKRLKKGPPSASGHFWEFFVFFCANHLRNTFSSLYQQAGKIGKNVQFIDIPNKRAKRASEGLQGGWEGLIAFWEGLKLDGERTGLLGDSFYQPRTFLPVQIIHSPRLSTPFEGPSPSVMDK